MGKQPVTILLDTHVLVWLAVEPRRLSKSAKGAVEKSRQRGGLAIASITLWELAMMVTKGRLAIQGTTANWTTELLAKAGVAVLDLSPSVAELATTSFGSEYPADPADRIIGATARAHGLPLVTADQRLHDCSLLRCIW